MYSSSYCFNFKAAALPVCFPPHGKKFAFPADHQQQGNAISRSLILCCQPIDSSSSDDNDNNVNTTSKDASSHDKSTTSSSLLRSLAVRVREELKAALTPPKHKEGKGDWKDLVLMSLSFALYVYMSQKLVSAYCAYMSSFHAPASSSW